MIHTYTGKEFHFDGPFNFDIKDIAHSLSLICRFGGHCKQFYSVAEHSVRVSYHCENKLWGLLHDAAEAYIGDIVQPLKRRLDIDNLEDKILVAIADKFKLSWTMPPEIKTVDRKMLITEYRDLMNTSIGGVPYPEKIVPMRNSKGEFLRRFVELTSVNPLQSKITRLQKQIAELKEKCGFSGDY